jgi:hypothetical protein
MSSSSELDYEPVERTPPPPPQITTEMRGYQAGSASGVLGVTGCSQLKDLLGRVADSKSPAREALGELLDRDTQVLDQLLSWTRGAVDGDFEIELPATALVDDARQLGIESVTVHLRIGPSLLETRFRHSVTGDQGLTKVEQKRMTDAIQRSANRAVNTSIAVLATQKVKQRVAAMVTQTVQTRVSQRATMRVQALAQMRHRVGG